MSDTINRGRRNLLGFGVLSAIGWRQAAFATSKTADTLPAPLAELAYGQVQFSDGPLDRQARENHRLVLGLDEDALLRPFRVRAGQRAPGQELGGWYDTYAFAPGATFGQWMSALSRYYAITGDAATRAKVQRLVRGYAATIDTGGSFYRNNRFPSYTYDKLAGGLLDAREVGPATKRHSRLSPATTQAAVPYLPPQAIPRNEHAQPGEDFSQHAWDESYTLPENQFQAWAVTGDRAHLRTRPPISLRRILRGAGARRKCASGQTCLQPCQRVEFGGAGLFVARRSDVSGGGATGLRDDRGTEFRHRRMGAGRAFCRSGQRRARRKPRWSEQEF